MAQVDYFLKLDGIPGESVDSKHKDEIDIMSFSFGETQTGDRIGRRRRRPRSTSATRRKKRMGPRAQKRRQAGT